MERNSSEETPAAAEGAPGDSSAGMAGADSSFTESKTGDSALFDTPQMESDFALYAEEFDASVTKRWNREYEAQARHQRDEDAAAAAEAHMPRSHMWEGIPVWREPNYFMSDRFKANPWGAIGCIAGLLVPILGVILGYVGLRRARVTGLGEFSAKAAIAVGCAMIALNMLMVMTGAMPLYNVGSGIA